MGCEKCQGKKELQYLGFISTQHRSFRTACRLQLSVILPACLILSDSVPNISSCRLCTLASTATVTLSLLSINQDLSIAHPSIEHARSERQSSPGHHRSALIIGPSFTLASPTSDLLKLLPCPSMVQQPHRACAPGDGETTRFQSIRGGRLSSLCASGVELLV